MLAKLATAPGGQGQPRKMLTALPTSVRSTEIKRKDESNVDGNLFPEGGRVGWCGH